MAYVSHPCPRRFGKTLNMNMLERFLSIEYAGQGEIFEGLSIWKDEKYRNLQGSYPVMSLSFAGIKSSSIDEARAGDRIRKYGFAFEGKEVLIKSGGKILCQP